MNNERRGRTLCVDDVLQIVLAARYTRVKRGNVNAVEELEVTEAIVKEEDDIAAIFFITHENGVIGQIQRFQFLC